MNQKTDWLGIISILLLVIGGSLLSYYYITTEINSCTSDPVKYAVKEIMHDEIVQNYSYIELIVYIDKDSKIPAKTFSLDLKK